MQTSYPEISSEERNLRTPYPKRIDALPFSSGGLIDGVSVQAFQGDNKCGLFSLKVWRILHILLIYAIHANAVFILYVSSYTESSVVLNAEDTLPKDISNSKSRRHRDRVDLLMRVKKFWRDDGKQKWWIMRMAHLYLRKYDCCQTVLWCRRKEFHSNWLAKYTSWLIYIVSRIFIIHSTHGHQTKEVQGRWVLFCSLINHVLFLSSWLGLVPSPLVVNFYHHAKT